jgi:type IV pilus assembly protein PilQ|tara:strand:- start:2517 stop:4397 length:1881 start_codon:yes stop_codon:yes gene_type:complete
MKKLKYLFYLLIFIHTTAIAQDRITQLNNQLETLIIDNPGLEKPVELSVSRVNIKEFINALAVANGVNISISPELNISITNTFSNVRVTDVLLFLCREYELDLTIVGNIISVSKFIPEKVIIPYVPKSLGIQFLADTLTLDLKKDSLQRVVKAITQISGHNVILAPGLSDKLVSVYIQEKPFKSAIEKLAFSNDLQARISDDGYYVIEKKSSPAKNSSSTKKTNAKYKNTTELSIEVDTLGRVYIEAYKQGLSGVVQETARQLNLNYFIATNLKGDLTLSMRAANIDELLTYMLSGTEYTFSKKEGIYLIGDRKSEGLRNTEVVKLQYRTVKDVIEIIPAELKKEVSIKEFSEQNSLILSGSQPKIIELKAFIKEIDQVVPLILIEVMIVDYNSTSSASLGMTAHLGGGENIITGGALYPGVDFQLNANSINQLINSFNGFGLMNLGKVNQSFYMSLKAMEDNGVVKVRSTPKLAALNSHEATMSIGNTEYYLEETNNVIGSQNPQNIITKHYKSVKADMSIKVKPIVSGDNQITLEIEVNQSDFTARISPDAPPGTVSRNFSSLIRVKDGEMVLLGGLEEKKISDSGSGLPWFSRIPVIKWFFSSRTKARTKNKLNIFIKPTVYY